MHLQSACTTTEERVKSSSFCRPGLKGRQCACVHVCMYWWGYVIYVLRTYILYCTIHYLLECCRYIYYTSKSEYHSNHKAEKTQMTHCSLSLALSQSMGRDLPATLSFSNIRSYKYVLRILCRKTLGLSFVRYTEQVPCEEANSSVTRDKASLACRSPAKLK